MAPQTSSSKTQWKRLDPVDNTKNLLIWAVIIGLVIWAASFLDFRLDRLIRASTPLGDFLSRMLPPDLGHIPRHVMHPLIETIQMSVLGTILGMILAIPVTWMAAYNITPFRPITYPLGRAITVCLRSIHIMVWGMVLVALLGYGPLAGVLALGIFSVGFLGKMWADTIENIDLGQLEAIRATGASNIQVIVYGVIPQVIPDIVGLSIYRWDINLRAGSVLGMVGAGGLGYELSRTINLLQYHRTASVLLMIFLVVVFSEIFSAWLRARVT